MEVDDLDIGSFYVKVADVSKLEINFQFQYDSKIWRSLCIMFFISARQDILLGSVFKSFGSLKGDRALSKVSF